MAQPELPIFYKVMPKWLDAVETFSSWQPAQHYRKNLAIYLEKKNYELVVKAYASMLSVRVPPGSAAFTFKGVPVFLTKLSLEGLVSPYPFMLGVNNRTCISLVPPNRFMSDLPKVVTAMWQIFAAMWPEALKLPSLSVGVHHSFIRASCTVPVPRTLTAFDMRDVEVTFKPVSHDNELWVAPRFEAGMAEIRSASIAKGPWKSVRAARKSKASF